MQTIVITRIIIQILAVPLLIAFRTFHLYVTTLEIWKRSRSDF